VVDPIETATGTVEPQASEPIPPTAVVPPPAAEPAVPAPDVPPPPAPAPAVTGDAAKARTWSRVQLARNLRRPRILDLVGAMAEEFIELHGDRLFGDDEAVVAGLARIGERRVVVVGQQKGADTEENIRRNFGMPHPEGYRKAMRIMELAERFGFPVVTFVDTPGAYPGVAAEQHGQGGSIARSQQTMLRLRVPTVACIIGEGMSGGAVAIAVADRVLMQENAIYAVISPEGCAQILWRDAGAAKKAAAAFRLDARHCLDLGVIDGVVPEPAGGAQADPGSAAQLLRDALVAAVDDLARIPAQDLLRQRRQKFRQMGVFS